MDYSKYFKIIEGMGAEYSDLRISNSQTEAILMENSNISSAQRNIISQYGIRVFYRGAWGFSYGDNFKEIDKAFIHALKLAKASSKQKKERFKLSDFGSNKDTVKSRGKNPADIPTEDKIKKMSEFDSLLKKKDVINRTIVSTFISQNSEFYNSHNTQISEPHYYFSLRAAVVGKNNGSIYKAYKRIGKSSGYEDFSRIDVKSFTDYLYENLKNIMKAKQAPAGRHPLVIDNMLCGVFFHEAVGHACEADAVLENSSVLKNKLNKKIAPDFLTLADNPLIENEGGYYRYDDEGIPAREKILIKNGILKNYLQSRETASKMKTEAGGNGRADSPGSMPCPRMSNTVLYPGDKSFEELIKGIKLGIYAKGSSGGVVEPTSGNFLFNAQEAFLIEKGKLTAPLRDVSFGGNILDILSKIEAIGKDQKSTFMGGHCGKKGQLVPVGEVTPHIKISEAMVGGKNS